MGGGVQKTGKRKGEGSLGRGVGLKWGGWERGSLESHGIGEASKEMRNIASSA